MKKTTVCKSKILCLGHKKNTQLFRCKCPASSRIQHKPKFYDCECINTFAKIQNVYALHRLSLELPSILHICPFRVLRALNFKIPIQTTPRRSIIIANFYELPSYIVANVFVQRAFDQTTLHPLYNIVYNIKGCIDSVY